MKDHEGAEVVHVGILIVLSPLWGPLWVIGAIGIMARQAFVDIAEIIIRRFRQ